LIYIFNENSSKVVLQAGTYIDLFITPILLLILMLNLALLRSVKNIRLYLWVEVLLSMIYITILVCAIVFDNNINEYFVNLFGIVRWLKSVLMIFVTHEAINHIHYFKKNILKPNEHIEEKKATLNIEKVLQILNYFKEKAFGIERENIDYCIKIITNNKLFIPQILEENYRAQSPKESNLKSEIAFWVQNFEKIEKLLNEDESPIHEKERSRIDTSRKIAQELKTADIEKLNNKLSKFIDHAESNKIVKALTNIFNLDFNVFHLKEASNAQELLALMYYVFYHLDYFHIFNIRTHKFINFAKKVQSSYHKNPYHNATHGADVMQVK
jgi:hypothetical protein